MSRVNWIAIGLIFAVGAAYQLTSPAIADVSWLFIVDEKLLAGARLYVDVIETNPPMSAFFYMPAVLLEHCLGVSAEIVQVWITLGLVAGSLALTLATMARCDRQIVGRLALAAAFVLVFLPMSTFSQREHLAIALVLPILAIYAARAEGNVVGFPLALVAGLGAGLAVTIKPHFAAALLLPAVFVAIRRRSIAPLFAPEHWVAGAVALAYLGVVIIYFRIYFTDILPMLSETYLASKRPLTSLIADPAFSLTVIAGLAVTLGAVRAGAKPLSWIMLLAAVGFLFAYVVQGKGWPYHLYPAFALVFLVFLTDALPRLDAAIREVVARNPGALVPVALSAIALVCLAGVVPFLKYQNRSALPLADVIRRTVPHPKMLAISYDIAIGHPLTRMVDGIWVGTVCSQWLSLAATRLALTPGVDDKTLARLESWIAHDRAILAHDLRDGRPDIVVIDHETFDFADLVANDAEVAGLMQGYVRVDGAGSVDLMMRRDRVAETVTNSPLNH